MVTGTQVSLTSIGIRTSTAGPIVLDHVTIDSGAVGVAAAPGSAVTLDSSSVHARHAIRGDVGLLGVNDLSQPPINLLGAIGLPLILLALVLEILHLLRQIRRVRLRRRDDLRRWRALAAGPAATKAANCSTCDTTQRQTTTQQSAPDLDCSDACRARLPAAVRVP